MKYADLCAQLRHETKRLEQLRADITSSEARLVCEFRHDVFAGVAARPAGYMSAEAERALHAATLCTTLQELLSVLERHAAVFEPPVIRVCGLAEAMRQREERMRHGVPEVPEEEERGRDVRVETVMRKDAGFVAACEVTPGRTLRAEGATGALARQRLTALIRDFDAHVTTQPAPSAPDDARSTIIAELVEPGRWRAMKELGGGFILYAFAATRDEAMDKVRNAQEVQHGS